MFNLWLVVFEKECFVVKDDDSLGKCQALQQSFLGRRSNEKHLHRAPLSSRFVTSESDSTFTASRALVAERDEAADSPNDLSVMECGGDCHGAMSYHGTCQLASFMSF